MTLKSGLRRTLSMGRFLNFAAGAANALCNDLLSREEITLSQWVVLSALWQRNDLTVSEIAEYTGNEVPAASRILDRMVEADLVFRSADSTDRRATRVSLSRRGESLRPLQRFFDDVNAILLNGFAAQEARLLYEMLERVTQNARSGRADAD